MKALLVGIAILGACVCAQARPPEAYRACQACHSLAAGENGLGPSLHGAYGRRAGQAPGFRYSNAMRRSDLVWDRAALTDFIRDPQRRVPGNRMAFSGLEDEAAVAAIVDFLAAGAAAAGAR